MHAHVYIYIYMVPPPKNLCRLQFYWYLQWILYILAPILFRLNLRHQQWENWKTEKLKNWKTEFHRRSLGSILLLWNSVFQFFSFSVLGFSWKVKTRKAEKTMGRLSMDFSMFFFKFCMVFIHFLLVFIHCSKVFIDFFLHCFHCFSEVFIDFWRYMMCKL